MVISPILNDFQIPFMGDIANDSKSGTSQDIPSPLVDHDSEDSSWIFLSMNKYPQICCSKIPMDLASFPWFPSTDAWGELGLGTSLRGAARPKPIDALYQVKVTQAPHGFETWILRSQSGGSCFLGILDDSSGISDDSKISISVLFFLLLQYHARSKQRLSKRTNGVSSCRF